jgi:hypothetical protein
MECRSWGELDELTASPILSKGEGNGEDRSELYFKNNQ